MLSAGFWVFATSISQKLDAFQAYFDCKENQIKIEELMGNLEFESNLIGKNLCLFSLIDRTGKALPVTKILTNKYNLIFISSFSTCSSCRDKEFEMWSAILKTLLQYKDLKMAGVIADYNINNKKKMIFAFKYAKTYQLKFEWYLDPELKILKYFNIKPTDVQLALLVDKSGNIIFAHQALAKIPEKTEIFQNKLMNFLNSTDKRG
ncbi:MAG: hypothetical protein Q9P14_16575 [candidate division KSB1 bacterium]|nr:hypothetical protein [candidate division KSB1 bacterium]